MMMEYMLFKMRQTQVTYPRKVKPDAKAPDGSRDAVAGTCLLVLLL